MRGKADWHKISPMESHCSRDEKLTRSGVRRVRVLRQFATPRTTMECAPPTRSTKIQKQIDRVALNVTKTRDNPIEEAEKTTFWMPFLSGCMFRKSPFLLLNAEQSLTLNFLSEEIAV